MYIPASSVEQYIDMLPDDRKTVVTKLRKVILSNIPEGFEETMQYSMPGYVVPHRLYPQGYHGKPADPLPFISIASQKNFIALYHMGLYANAKLLEWFRVEYPYYCTRKLDMGKSCIRFKKMDDIPFELIGELVSKMSVAEWIQTYEESRRG